MMFHIFLKTDSVKELLKLLEQSSQFTSLKVNYGKSEICGIGSKKGAIGAFSQFRIVNLINDLLKYWVVIIVITVSWPTTETSVTL